MDVILYLVAAEWTPGIQAAPEHSAQSAAWVRLAAPNFQHDVSDMNLGRCLSHGGSWLIDID